MLSLTLRKKKISPFASKFTNNPFGLLKLSIDTGKTLLLFSGSVFLLLFFTASGSFHAKSLVFLFLAGRKSRVQSGNFLRKKQSALFFAFVIV